MAKKATEAAVEETKPEDLLEQVRKDIASKYKTDSFISSGNALIDREQIIISTGSPNVDLALNGGIPEGCFFGISGKPKLGKTTLLLSTAKEAQKLGRVVLYIDAEHRLKKMNLEACKGLDLSEDKFIHVKSTKDMIMSAQKFLDVAEMYIRSIPNLFVIIDSASCLVDQRVVEGGQGTETRGAAPKAISQFVDIVAPIVAIQNSNVCSVSHIIADTGGKTMAGAIEKTANRLIYQADVKLKATYVTKWMDGEKHIGDQIHWDVVTSALGGPGKADSWHRFGMGIDAVYESVKIAQEIDLIKGGTWGEFVFLEKYPDLLGEEKIPKLQGAEKMCKALSENPAWFDALQKEIKGFLNP